MAFKGTDRRTIIRRYLLNDLPEPDKAGFEQDYFADDDLFDELVASEYELMDSYARGEMLKHEQALLERRIAASPAIRRKALFSVALMRYLARDAPRPSPVDTGWKATWLRGLTRVFGGRL